MTRKTTFFDGWSWFKFNNLGLALVANLKIYTSLSKGLKLKGRKFLGLIPTKLQGKTAFCPPPLSWTGLKSTEKLLFTKWHHKWHYESFKVDFLNICPEPYDEICKVLISQYKSEVRISFKRIGLKSFIQTEGN